MFKALLLQPPRACKAFTRSGSMYPPLGLLQLQATVSRSVCRVVDADALNLSQADTVQSVVECRPCIVGMTVTTMTMGLVEEYARLIKVPAPCTRTRVCARA